jgi:hypothetical protein
MFTPFYNQGFVIGIGVGLGISLWWSQRASIYERVKAEVDKTKSASH